MSDIFDIVKKHIDKMDYCCLLESGAPDDEFDSESKEIVKKISLSETIEEIAEIIASVFSRTFADNLSKEMFLNVAIHIKEDLTKL